MWLTHTEIDVLSIFLLFLWRKKKRVPFLFPWSSNVSLHKNHHLSVVNFIFLVWEEIPEGVSTSSSSWQRGNKTFSWKEQYLECKKWKPAGTCGWYPSCHPHTASSFPSLRAPMALSIFLLLPVFLIHSTSLNSPHPHLQVSLFSYSLDFYTGGLVPWC